MRRIIPSLVLAFLSFLALAQNSTDGTLKFLGIPVDGTKQNMISQLKAKGFQYFSHNDCLAGQFNGRDVEIHVVTNHGVVDRIYVEYPLVSTESRIISEYNVLLDQFNRNKKYVSPRKNEPIPPTEHIAYEMSANHKEYSAGFLYLSPDLLSEEQCEYITKIMERAQGVTEKTEATKLGEEIVDFLESNDLPEKEMQSFIQGFLSLLNNRVWFTIHEEYGQFRIGLYYDNMKNRPDGEDL